jgi:hypothetical protein
MRCEFLAEFFDLIHFLYQSYKEKQDYGIILRRLKNVFLLYQIHV